MLVAVPCMFLRHARLMPRLSGYRVSSMSARVRPIHVYFRRIPCKQRNQQTKGAAPGLLSSCWINLVLTKQQAIELGSSSVRLHLRRQCPALPNASTLEAKRKHNHNVLQLQRLMAPAFCIAGCRIYTPKKRPRGFVCWRMTGTHA